MAALGGLYRTYPLFHGAGLSLSTSSSSSNRRPLACASLNMELNRPFKLLFVEMGVGYDQHGQDITAAAVRACKNAISSNSIPAFRTGAIPGVSWHEMKLKLKLGVPRAAQSALDIEKVKAVFPYNGFAVVAASSSFVNWLLVWCCMQMFLSPPVQIIWNG